MGKKPAKRVGTKSARRATRLRAAANVPTDLVERYQRALERNVASLDRHSDVLDQHTRALSRAALQGCVLNALGFHDSTALNRPLADLFRGIVDPVTRIDDACRAHNPPCYSFTRAQIHDKVRGKELRYLKDFIACIAD
jgi:hypothetical protein